MTITEDVSGTTGIQQYIKLMRKGGQSTRRRLSNKITIRMGTQSSRKNHGRDKLKGTAGVEVNEVGFSGNNRYRGGTRRIRGGNICRRRNRYNGIAGS